MKINYKIFEIEKSVASAFVEQTHYSPIMPKLTKHFLGFYIDTILKGVLTLGYGTQPKHTIQKLFPTLDTKDYFEIGKMCMSEDMPRNSESQMISQTIKWLKQNLPERIFLYTMADGIMGKCGYVYQASNFYYGGEYLTQVYQMPNGEKLHPRSAKQLLIENAKYTNKDKLFWMTKDFMKLKGIRFIEGQMFRYIYPLNKTAKNHMKNSSTVQWTKNYPKDSDLKWFDKTVNPKIQISKPAFTYEDMKYNPQFRNANSTNISTYF
jgi:hypothetical protein